MQTLKIKEDSQGLWNTVLNCYVEGCLTMTATSYLELLTNLKQRHNCEECVFLIPCLYLVRVPFLKPLKDITHFKVLKGRGLKS